MRRQRTSLIPYAHHSLGRAETLAVLDVLRRGPLTQGPRVAALERDFARLLARRYAVALSSGTAALHAAVWASRLPAGSEVITSPLTFAATANILVHAGLVPKFCDVDPRTGVMTPESAAAVITGRTSAILPVDYSGFPCDGRGFRALSRRYGLAFLEDSTHLLGGCQRGRPAGGWADVAAFSLHPSKAITAGEGGVLVTDSVRIAQRARRFRNHGFETHDAKSSASQRDLAELGLNYRLSELHAALAREQLKRLSGFVRRRASLAMRYIRRMRSIEHLDLPALPQNAGDAHAWHLFVVRVRRNRSGISRHRLFEEMRQRGIGVQVHYRIVSAYRYYRQRWPQSLRACPHANTFSSHCLSFPLFPTLHRSQQERVIRTLREALGPRIHE